MDIITQYIPNVCDFKGFDLIYYLWLPLFLFMLLLLVILFRETIKIRLFRVFSTQGFIRIFMIMSNKRLVPKLIRLDKYNNFVFPILKGKRYTLESMYDFIIGYDSFNFPIFMYDNNFIFPLKLDKRKVESEIQKQLNITDAEDISAVTMRIDPSVYNTVYEKKLLADLYSISPNTEFNQKLIYVGLIVVGIIILYYTGLLEKILSFVGVK